MNRAEHLLSIVAEEAVEVAQRATKALRFGIDEVQPGQDHTNWERIEHEFHDLIAALEMAHGRPLNIRRVLIDAKKEKVEKFLAYSAALGTLSDTKEYTEGRDPQHVLKAERASADATDRGDRANASPDGGPMGVGQAAAAAPAGVDSTRGGQGA
jgi:hypothetical protein